MPSIYKARWRNALKKAAKINRLIRKGYHVFYEGKQVSQYGGFRLEGKELLFKTGMHSSLIFFVNDSDYDMGRYMSIIDYNGLLSETISIYRPDAKVTI